VAAESAFEVYVSLESWPTTELTELIVVSWFVSGSVRVVARRWTKILACGLILVALAFGEPVFCA